MRRFFIKNRKRNIQLKIWVTAEDIDRAARKSLDYYDFLLCIEIAGYEVKQGEYIQLRAAGRERFIRWKTPGGYYTEDPIKERGAKIVIHRPKK